MRKTFIPSLITAALLAGPMFLTGCGKPAPTAGVKKVAAGSEFSGFLKDYSALKPNAKLGSEILTYVNMDQAKHLRRYAAVTVDPVEVFLSANANPDRFQARAGESLARYFKRALEKSVSDAFPVVEEAGPLVLRLRCAIVGVDTSDAPGDATVEESDRLASAARIGNVRIEMELTDSMTGERIAAAVDKAALGAGAEVGAYRFERIEKYTAARQAFDEWAARVREFLDSEHELSPEEAKRASDAYRPYGNTSAATQPDSPTK
jgi:hypothetical protein